MSSMGRLALALWCVGLLVSCATTEYKPYEGRNNLFEGRGGTKVIVNGVEFWDDGEPPRKFTVLGIIDDQRPAGAIPMSQLRSDVANWAKQVGGDAVVVLGSSSQVVGYITNMYGPTYSTGTTVPARRHYAKFAVIKYVD